MGTPETQGSVFLKDLLFSILSLFISLILLATFVSAPLFAAEVSTKGIPTVPGESCQTEPLENWEPQEKWVWEQICEGKIADLAKKYGGSRGPKKIDDWSPERVIRPEFLETILLHEPYRSALPHQGVRIVGVWFTESLDLSYAILVQQLWLDYSRFESPFILTELQASQLVSLEGSMFIGEVNLIGAKIGGQLNMSASKFKGKLNMNSLEVGSSLLMSNGAEFTEVNLGSAKVDSVLSMIGSKFTGKLDMNSLEVERSLYMRNKAEFDDVDLIGAKIGGQLDMSASKFKGKLNMDSLEVGKTVFMRGSEITNLTPWIFEFSEIGGSLDITGSTLPSLELTGTRIHGEFRLGSSKHSPTMWHEDSTLTLRNTEVEALQDSPESWENLELELEGFTYARLGGFGADASYNMASRNIDWLKGWLGKYNGDSPQPYLQLANVLRQMGYEDKASGVLYAGRAKAHKRASGLSWLWLWIQWVFIGYGYYNFLAVFWILGLWLSGILVLRFSGQSQRHGLSYWGCAYSLDILLPIIHLRKAHYDKIVLAGPTRVYFYVHQLLGYVLALFLIAGLSGLTK